MPQSRHFLNQTGLSKLLLLLDGSQRALVMFHVLEFEITKNRLVMQPVPVVFIISLTMEPKTNQLKKTKGRHLSAKLSQDFEVI